MAEKKNAPVTLVKGNRKITTSLPREIVQYKAAGWREEKAAKAPEADSPEDVTENPKSAEDKSSGDNPRPAAGKGGTKK